MAEDQVTISADPPGEEIIEDIGEHIQAPAGGFFEKYFPSLCQNNPAKGGIQQFLDPAHGSETLLSVPPPPQGFLSWFSSFSSLHSTKALGKWQMRQASQTASGDDNALLLLTSLPMSDSRQQTLRWAHVHVVGAFYQDATYDYRDGLLRLCEFAQRIFTSQPTRLFLHAFYLRGSMMEVWVFDRSGMYCSEAFDYLNDFEKFVGILLCYQAMTERDVGLHDLIISDDTSKYIIIEDDSFKLPGQRLLLESEPIALPEEIVGNGTTCYRAKVPHSEHWDYVVKFKWRLAWRDRPEENMLKLIKDKSVFGVICFEYCRELSSTAKLREGLQLERYRKLFKGDNTEVANESSGQTTPDSILKITKDTRERFENRIFSCIITSPPGRPLRTFKSSLELLQVLLDAVKGHRSLLQDANILHQDISPGNIIITDAQGQGQPKGILIGFDVAMDLAVGPRTPGEVTGTRPFMAVGILLGRRHWYRHDLESFLYVLIWSIITDGAESPPRDSKLRMWSRGDWDDIAARKSAEMEEAGFGGILAEFPEKYASLKQLAENIRRLLFPIIDGAVWTGTDNSAKAVNDLYDGIIGAFEDAIAKEGSR